MTAEAFGDIRLTTKVNVYFDGEYVNHSSTLPNGIRKSVGVVLPTTLTFGVAVAEIMECIGGSCEYKLDGTGEWKTSGVGNSFQVSTSSKLDIRMTEAYHYICHYV